MELKSNNMESCIETTSLIKIEKEHFYSVKQTETYSTYQGDKLISIHSVQGINNNAVNTLAGLCIFMGFAILLIWELRAKYEKRKT